MASPLLHVVRSPDAKPNLVAIRGMSPHRSFHDYLLARSFAPSTISEYRRIVFDAECWCEARGRTLATAPGSLVAQYADAQVMSWSTRKALRSALRHYWEFHRRKNPPLGVIRVPPQPKRECRAHEEDEAHLLAKVARAHADRKGFALALGLYQAMRREEIACTRWADYDERYVKILGKGSKTRRIDLHPEVLDKLAVAPRSGEFIFPGRFGGHASKSTIWAWIRKLGEEAGVVGITPHRLRHTCLATQNDNNGNLLATMDFAGHSKPETTLIYTRTKAHAMRKAMLSVDYLGEGPGRAPGRGSRPPQWGLFDRVDDTDW